MNHATRTHDRYSPTRTGGSANPGRGGRSGSPAQGRSGAPSRSGYGRRPAALQGEFALPVTVTPALPAAATFAELSMPPALLKVLTSLGMNEPFPIQAATLPN